MDAARPLQRARASGGPVHESINMAESGRRGCRRRRDGGGRDVLEPWRAGAGVPTARRVPVFEVDPAWPKLPNNWVVGHVASVAVDSRDHVWMLHRPNTIPEDQRSHAAPPVLEFDADGEVRERVGRARAGLRLAGQRTRHRRRLQGQRVDRRQRPGRAVAAQRSTTTCSSSSTTRESSCCRSAGRTVSRGNADTKSVHQPADVFVWPKTNEAFVADGYGNRRVDRVRRRYRRVQADVGRVRQRADRCDARGARRRRRSSAGARWRRERRRRPVAPRRLSIPRVRARRSSAARCTP